MKDLDFSEEGSYRMTIDSFVDSSVVENSEKLLVGYFRNADLIEVKMDLDEYSRPF